MSDASEASSSLESIFLERRRLQDEIARLQEHDQALYREQIKWQTRVKTPEEEEEEKSRFNVDATIQELEQPVNPYWGSDKVALASYPRSGNSLLRRIVEKLTQTVTGSDARPDRPLVQQLALMGMRGEGVMDSRVWCVKTHYPERVGRARLVVTRAIVIVRNPFDAIASFFQMMLTDSHTQSVSAEEVTSRFGALWNDFLCEELSIWQQFHTHWRQMTAPLLVLRYEDLVQHRAKTIQSIADFLFSPLYESGIADQGEIQSRIDSLTTLSEKDVGLYPPKSSDRGVRTEVKSPCPTVLQTGEGDSQKSSTPTLSSIPKWDMIDPEKPGFLKSLKYFNHEQYRYVLAAARSDLVRYGYWDACVAARPEHSLDLVPYVDINPGGCIINDEEKIRLNSRFALRPRTNKDPYGRGFDVRWEDRLNALPKPISSNSSRDQMS